MIRYNRLAHQFVNDMPDVLEPGVLYVSMRYALALHLCCCGCGREISTPFSPAQWKMSFDGDAVSLSPSVGSWNLPCRSHYIVSGGRVIEAMPWSEKAVTNGQKRDKRALANYFAKAASSQPESNAPPAAEPTRRGWGAWIGGFFKPHS
jgi:hypothetical protein